jgi:hypothetical protein
MSSGGQRSFLFVYTSSWGRILGSLGLFDRWLVLDFFARPSEEIRLRLFWSRNSSPCSGWSESRSSLWMAAYRCNMAVKSGLISTLSGLETATFRLVVKCLNQLR